MASTKDATDRPNNETEKTETQQGIIESINQLIRQKTEIDVKSTAKSLNKNDVDLASIMSDAQVQRELRSLERIVAGYIGICEDKLRQRIEDLRVTGLQAAPRLRPAHVVGYTTKLWGPFPVLLHGRRDDVVRGMACEIEGSGPKRRLEEYEGKDYDEWELDLRLDKPDGKWDMAPGVTFKWVGPRDELEEGTFSLSKWQDI
ncbi:hypothetical protein LA080_013671 [Diaporthe eres]|nr:hypothetical protein LA080_013671 [Diaporthe eres]